jgi:hypothetical protein
MHFNKLQKAVLAKQWQRGAQAKLDGKALSDNPQSHIPLSPIAMAWDLGFKGLPLSELTT